MTTVPPVGDPRRAIECRALILAPRPEPPAYAPSTMELWRLRLFEMWRLEEARKLAGAAGVPTP